MFEAQKRTAVPANIRVEAPASSGRPGVPEDRIRPRWYWAPIALVAVLFASLQIAVVVNLHGRIVRGKALGPGPTQSPGVVPAAGEVNLASSPAAPPVPGNPKPEEGGPGDGDGEIKDARPADEKPPPLVAGQAGPPKPVEDAPVPAADPVALGRELFARTWRPDDPRCHGGDGLGPVYNATSCVDCHNQGGPGGGGPADRNVQLVTGIGYFLFSGDLTVIVDRNRNVLEGGDGIDQGAERADMVKAHPGFRDATSAVLHRFGVDPDYDGWRSTILGRCRTGTRIRTTTRGRSGRRDQGKTLATADLEGELAATIRDLENGLGMNRVVFRMTARNSPPLFGAGLIDGVSESELERLARNQPKAIRGQVHRLKDGRLGRFGWKAQVASLEDFVLTACANELGLEVEGHHQATSPLAPDAKARGLDLTADECAALVAYVRSLAPTVSPEPPDAHGAVAVAEGREVFHSVGCGSCHTADLGSIRGIYSDLLLHDMGAELSDSGSYYATEDTEAMPLGEVRTRTLSRHWRTPPLWGFRDTAPYLHDGRARNLAEAVALHHGQGASSANKFRSMSVLKRSRVETFLNSLGAPAAPRTPHRAGEAADHPANHPGDDLAPAPGGMSAPAL